MNEIKHGRGYSYLIKYHLVWRVKYRQAILTDQIKEDIKQILCQIALDNNVSILEMLIEKSYVHIHIECTPQHYIPNLIKAFKGVSARMLFKKHPLLKNKIGGSNLWNSSYFVITSEQYAEEQIQQYLLTTI